MKRLLPIMVLCLLGLGQIQAQFNVTFELNTEMIDMVDPSGIYIAGGEGFGVPGDNQMTDDDGDGIYSITFVKEEGFTSHYTFLNGNCGDWSCKEQIGGLSCADPTNFNDRFLGPISGDVTIQACFGNCADDGSCVMMVDTVAIVFNVNTALIDVSPDGLFIAGGGGFGSPGDNQLFDEDGDGIYTGVFLKPQGFSSYYTFLNGNCPDWSCKENIGGLPCANPENFNDRFLPSVDSLTIINACFGTCDDDGACSVVLDSIQITFELNTAGIEVDPAGIFLAGGGNFGVPGDNPMVDPDGDGVYTFTSTRPVGFASHYTFLNGNCPDWSCKEDISGLDCADPNSFNDRYLDTTEEDTVIKACFGNCDPDGNCLSINVNDLISDPSLFSIVPTIAYGSTEIQYGDSATGVVKNITVSNLAGQQVYLATDRGDQAHQINTSGYASGVYFVSVRTGTAVYTKKFLVR